MNQPIAGVDMDGLFAIRTSRHVLTIGQRVGAELNRLEELRAPEVRGVAWSADGRQLAVLDLAGKRIQRLAFDRGGVERLPSPPTLPKGSVGDCLVVNGAVVYVGGGSRRSPSSLWMLQDGALSSVPLPEGTGRSGKSIDHLFLVGDRLIAVDNIVVPKWVLTFRVGAGGVPAADGIHPLTVHSTYEQVKRGATGLSLFALYSSAVGRGGTSNYLAVLDKKQLDELGHVSLLREPFWTDGAEQPPLVPKDAALDECPAMAFVGDLLVLGNRHGLFVLDLEGMADSGPTPAPVTEPAPRSAAGSSTPPPVAADAVTPELKPDGATLREEYGLEVVDPSEFHSLRGPRGRGIEFPPIRQVAQARAGAVFDLAAVGDGGVVVAWTEEHRADLEWVSRERLRAAAQGAER